jgi:hypothetical protein
MSGSHEGIPASTESTSINDAQSGASDEEGQERSRGRHRQRIVNPMKSLTSLLLSEIRAVPA